MKSYNHFSQNERFFIDSAYNEQHLSIRKIAKHLNKSPSAVSREIRRNLINGDYVYIIADNKAKLRSWHCHSMHFNKYNEFTKLFVQIYDKRTCGVYPTIYLIKKNYPAIKCPSARQVFRWIESNEWVINKTNRLRYKYKKGGKRTNGFFNKIFSKYVQPFWVRPRVIDKRKEFGHWEGDLIIGRKCNNFKNILTLNERKSRMLFACFVKTKSPWKIVSAFRKIIKENNLPIKTLTLDNGKEWDKIALLGKWCNLTIYICEAYSSFQRGSNENLNGFIRRFWKKGSDFNNYSNEDLKSILFKINNMPRQILGWKSSQEVFEKEKATYGS